MSSSSPTALLVLGLGNVLCRDDGLGAAAVRLLSLRYLVPDGVTVLDGGTLGLTLLPVLEDARAAILVDAVRGDGPPGSLVRLEDEEVDPVVAERLSVHQVGVADLLSAARWCERCPRPLVLLGLVPESLELGVGRTPRVEEALPGLVERIVAEACALGYAFTPRTSDEVAADAPDDRPCIYDL